MNQPSNKEYLEFIKILEKEAESLNITIDYSPHHENCFVPTQNIIVINTKQNIRSRYYTLLHEMGHVLLRKNKDEFTKNYPDLTNQTPNNKSYRIDILREEVAAWDLGKDLACHLELRIDEYWLNRYMKQNLYDYAKWVLNPKAFISNNEYISNK